MDWFVFPAKQLKRSQTPSISACDLNWTRPNSTPLCFVFSKPLFHPSTLSNIETRRLQDVSNTSQAHVYSKSRLHQISCCRRLSSTRLWQITLFGNPEPIHWDFSQDSRKKCSPESKYLISNKAFSFNKVFSTLYSGMRTKSQGLAVLPKRAVQGRSPTPRAHNVHLFHLYFQTAGL